MKKVNYLLFIAVIFVGLVMVKLMFEGVKLPERRMVKWSSASSASGAGEKLSIYLFPILNQYDSFVIRGNSHFTQEFVKGFRDRVSQETVSAKIQVSAEEIEGKNFNLQILPLDQVSMQEQCKKASKAHCVGLKAFKKFSKKERDPNLLWISMYRLNEDHAVLFFKSSNSTLQ